MDKAALGTQFHFRWIDRAEPEPRLGALPDCRQTGYYRENEAEFRQLTDRYGEALRRGALAPVQILSTGQAAGFGLYAAAGLAAGDLVGEYAGIIRRTSPLPRWWNPFRRRATDYAWDYPEAGEGWPPLEINAFRAGNALRFVNHSFEANCAAEHTEIGGRWTLFFVALRKIASGTQLTVDYGEEYWTARSRTLILFDE